MAEGNDRFKERTLDGDAGRTCNQARIVDDARKISGEKNGSQRTVFRDHSGTAVEDVAGKGRGGARKLPLAGYLDAPHGATIDDVTGKGAVVCELNKSANVAGIDDIPRQRGRAQSNSSKSVLVEPAFVRDISGDVKIGRVDARDHAQGG